jgi:hypothetical protein
MVSSRPTVTRGCGQFRIFLVAPMVLLLKSIFLAVSASCVGLIMLAACILYLLFIVIIDFFRYRTLLSIGRRIVKD